MGLSDPFGITYEGSRQALGSIGQGLQTAASAYAARKQRERELAQEYQLKGALAEQEAKVKTQYPSITDLYLIKSLNGGDSQDQYSMSPEDIKADFLSKNPQYKSEDIVLKPKTISQKGIPRQIQVPEVDQKLWGQRIEKEKISSAVKESAIDTLDTISKVKAGKGYFGIGGAIPAIPGLQPEKVKWEANVNKLLSGKILDVMNKMKQASRTGATGFGQLNRSELKVLTDASTALKKTMDPDDAMEIIEQMESKLMKITGDIKQISSDEEFDALPKGAEFIDPDGQKRIKQ